MFGLSLIDIAVIFLYFVAIVWLGVRASKRIKGEEDYFLGGRKFGKLTSTFASFGQATSADGPAGVATTTFTNGASGIWSALLMLFVTPLFWITSPWLRRLRIITMGDFFLERYGSRMMSGAYAFIGTIGMMGLLSVGYMAVSKTALAMTSKTVQEFSVEEQSEYAAFLELQELEDKDFSALNEQERERLESLRESKPMGLFSHLNEDVVIWCICILVIVYTALGGLEAAFYTDMLQGVFIILLSVILLPFAWSEINTLFGGNGIMNALGHVHEQLPQSYFDIFGSPLVMDFTWYYIAAVALVSGITVVVQPNQLVTAGAAKDEYTARVGFVTGTFMKRVVTVLWGVFALAAAVLFSDSLSNPDYVWGHATKELLGGVGLGLVGLMLASMMAALMSTADCLMLTVSGLIVRCIYTPIVPNRSQGHYVWAGRFSGGLFLIGAALATTQFDNILQVLKFIWEFFVIFAAAFWLGLKWRRATRVGAWASILCTFALFYFVPLLLTLVSSDVRQNEVLLGATESRIVELHYLATEADVEDSGGVVLLGETVSKSHALPSRSLFWSKGFGTNDLGEQVGRGYPYLEMLLLDRMGFNLGENSFATNETIRLIVRLLTPFIILVLVSLLTQRDDKKMLDRFFAKMRLPVMAGGESEITSDSERSLESGKKMLLFPNSEWEIYRWSRVDAVGFAASCSMVLGVIGFLYFMVNLGS